MKRRVTSEVIRSGQPRAYADTEYVCRAMFEHTSLRHPDIFVPHFMSLEAVQRQMLRIDGYVPNKRGNPAVGPFDTYLDYLRPFDPQPASNIISGGDPNEIVASMWEFRTVSPYTD